VVLLKFLHHPLVVVVVVVVVVEVAGCPLFSPILFSNVFKPQRKILNRRLKKLSREF
jgi:hypothetical protein